LILGRQATQAKLLARATTVEKHDVVTVDHRFYSTAKLGSIARADCRDQNNPNYCDAQTPYRHPDSLGDSPAEISAGASKNDQPRTQACLCRPNRLANGNDEDFDVLTDGVVVGGIFKANAAPVGAPWFWTLAFGHHEDRTVFSQIARRPT